MGKRKGVKVTVKKRKREIAKVFPCPFCHNTDSVVPTLNRETKIGRVTCRICQASFESRIQALHGGIDVYHEWIDECERVQEATGSAAHSDVGPLPTRAPYDDGRGGGSGGRAAERRVGDGSGAPSSYTGSHDYRPPAQVLAEGKRVDDSDNDDFLDEPSVLLRKEDDGATAEARRGEVDEATSFLDSLA